MKIHLSPSASIPAHYGNRHAVITGPTGTGKTITVMRLIESLITLGTPVFAPDVKGDLSALSRCCKTNHITPRISLWNFGPDLLARALELTEAQSGALEIAFAWAEEADFALDSISDLRTILGAMSQNPASVSHLGHVTRASIGIIQRALLRLGPNTIFGKSAFDVADLMDHATLHLLDASRLYHSPTLYGALLMYVLRELATRLPECGDLDRPRLALVFDEAHTMFHEASPTLLRSIEATARLIRSKGVMLIWASQSLDDIPRIIADQCATKIAHCSRDLAVGFARFTTLDSHGQPTETRVIRPDMPSCPLGPVERPALSTTADEDHQSAPVFLAVMLIIFCLLLITGAAWAVYSGYGFHVAATAIALWYASR